LDIKVRGYDKKRFIQKSAALGWWTRPNVKGYLYRYGDGTKFHVETNSYGFSDSERDLQKTRPRIALIGDSTTQSWEAEKLDRGQFVIEALLDNYFEVLNFGVRGYGTDQTYILFENIGIYFSPDIVIYTFCINDIDNNVKTRNKPYFSLNATNGSEPTLKRHPPQFVLDNLKDPRTLLKSYSFTYRTYLKHTGGLLHRVLGLFQPSNAKPKPQTSLKSHFELRPYKKIYNEEDTRRMEVTIRLISLLNDLTQNHGMKLLVVEGLYKSVIEKEKQEFSIQQYGDVFDFDKVSRILENFTSKNKIDFVSLPRLLRDSSIPVETLFHRSENIHVKKEGIEFSSRAIVEKLRSLHWINQP
jgi:hypothetical protein